MTQVMLSMCKQDKGKGPYTEFSTLLLEFIEYKIKFSKCVACLDSREWKCSLIFFESSCVHVVLLV